MHRRHFLQTLNAMGASIVLPASAFNDEGRSVIPPTSTLPLIAPTNAVEVAANGWDIPKVGVVAVGGLGCTILNDLAGRLPLLGAAQLEGVRRVGAIRANRIGEGMRCPIATVADCRILLIVLRKLWLYTLFLLSSTRKYAVHHISSPRCTEFAITNIAILADGFGAAKK